jgi:predicted DNA-binding protein
MPATRTQIYLSREQRKRLDEITRREGKSLAAIIREALDQYLSEQGADSEASLDATFGISKELEVPSRDEWQRG